VSGNRREAQKLLEELRNLSERRYVSPIGRALIYIGLGDKERAFEWLDRASDDHDPWLAWLKADPIFDDLRNDPRFAVLLKTAGL